MFIFIRSVLIRFWYWIPILYLLKNSYYHFLLQLSGKLDMHKFPLVAQNWRSLIYFNLEHSPKAYSSLTDLQIELNVTPFMLITYQFTTIVSQSSRLQYWNCIRSGKVVSGHPLFLEYKWAFSDESVSTRISVDIHHRGWWHKDAKVQFLLPGCLSHYSALMYSWSTQFEAPEPNSAHRQPLSEPNPTCIHESNTFWQWAFSNEPSYFIPVLLHMPCAKRQK